MKKKIFLILILITFFFRFYKLYQTFGFYGDIARDHERLMEWYQGAKPPLLGPNTILMIINQSPWYYYLSFPVFALTRSAYSMNFTLFLVSSFTFALSLWVLRKYKEIIFIYILFFLSSIQPMFLEQQRLPWNPSFSVPFLILALSGILRLKNKYSSFISWITLISLCLALGMTYTVFPVFLTLTVIVFFLTPVKYRRYLLFQLIIALLIVFSPLIIFEIKSNFFTIRRLTTSLNIPPLNYSFTSQISFTFQTFFTAWENIKISLWQYLLFIFLLALQSYKAIRNPDKHNYYFRLFFLAALVSTLFTLLMPFRQPYYLYGVIFMWFLTIASMKPLLMFPTVLILMTLWMNPVLINNYFKQTNRPLEGLNSCARQFCLNNPGSYYVSGNNQFGIHSGHEYAFLLNKNGCFSRDIVSFPNLKYDHMIVVVDQATFIPHKTDFYELQQFGNYTVEKNLICSNTLQYWLLRRTGE